jgi:hypothetical protein
VPGQTAWRTESNFRFPCFRNANWAGKVPCVSQTFREIPVWWTADLSFVRPSGCLIIFGPLDQIHNHHGIEVMLVDVNGAKLYVDVENSGLIPEGGRMREKPTLLLLHGGPGFDHSGFKRIKGLCGAKPPQKPRWTNAVRWEAIER